MQLSIQTGGSAYVPGALTIEDDNFGYNYTGFRALSRFDIQLDDSRVGMITWPGGSLAENGTDRYGMEFDGMWAGNPAAGNLAELMALANSQNSTLSIVLPTLRYAGDLDAMRADVHRFMGDLLGGAYGPLPEKLVFEIGSEFYSTFGGDANAPQTYGHIADAMVRELQACLDDPQVNVLDHDIDFAIQGGRNLAEDEALRDTLGDDTLRNIDYVIHHRFAPTAIGIDKSADEMGRILDAWEQDAVDVGGHRPELFLGTYNVASCTRAEALGHYLKEQDNLGHHIDNQDIDLDARTHVGFETYYQDKLSKYDYGPEHPRVLLEMMAEYGAEGMGASGTYGTDMQHAARLTTIDADGHPVKLIGQEMLDMMAESIDGTNLLKISLTNDRGDDVWAYGYENADKMVLFLSADDTAPGNVTLDIDGLGSTYRAVWGDSLNAHVPSDWMTRFGVVDNPYVDETPESRTYALGIRSEANPALTPEGYLSVALDQPYEMIRLSFAKTDLGAQEIQGFAEGGPVDLVDGMSHLDADAHDYAYDDYGVPMVEMAPASLGDDGAPDDDADGHGLLDAVHSGGEGGLAIGLAMLMPLLALAGM